MQDRRMFLLSLAATLTSQTAAPPAFAQTAEAVGRVAAVQGSASAQSAAQPRALQSGLQLFSGERVQTAAESRLHAELGTSTQLYLGERTQVRIDGNLVRRGGTIRLGSGAMMFDRSAPAPMPDVVIQSPFAMIAVRGTKVFAGPSNGVFGVFVERGEVSVRNAGGAVTLRAGQGTDIGKPGAKPTPAAAWSEPRIRAALASVR